MPALSSERLDNSWPTEPERIHPTHTATAPLRGRDRIRGLSLVIPAWNEALRLPDALNLYLPALEATNLPFEILVVADGVTDSTVSVAQTYLGFFRVLGG